MGQNVREDVVDIDFDNPNCWPANAVDLRESAESVESETRKWWIRFDYTEYVVYGANCTNTRYSDYSAFSVFSVICYAQHRWLQ